MQVTLDIYNERATLIGVKRLHSDLPPSINKWIKQFDNKSAESDKEKFLGYLCNPSPDFQHNNQMYISQKKGIEHFNFWVMSAKNFTVGCVYFAVRHAIKASWINDRDQFLYPNKKWQKDKEFQNDCLAFALFHSQNRISANQPQHCHIERSEISRGYINHFIPFSEKEVNAKSRFTSHFLHDFINGKCATSRNDTHPCHTERNEVSQNVDSTKNNRDISAFSKPQYDKSRSKSQSKKLFELESELESFIPTKPLEFSQEAQAVFEAGLELWKYYHTSASDKTSPQSLANPYAPYNPNASLYDIKEFFKGRKMNDKNGKNKKGKLNATSKDEYFNALMSSLNLALANLAKKLEPKIYEYGFLEE